MRCKYILLSIAALMTISVSAQGQSLREILEGKTKYVPEEVENADSTVKVVSAVELGIVYQAVSPALKVVTQQYKLEKDGKYFGRNNKSYFGESESLAIKIAGGTILQNKVVYPWNHDKNFQTYSETHSPQYHSTFQTSLEGEEPVIVNFELGTPYVKPVGEDNLLYSHSDVYSDFGLSVDTAAGEKEGYMLWVYKTDDKYEHAVEVLNITASADSTVIAMAPAHPENLLGGLYVVPVNERPGTVSFHLVGVVSTINDVDWSLKLFTKEEQNINLIN